jgi:NAD(P)-dependent dehydrogenase (short-subunit alcohol dehydrogenase family)
MIERAALVVGAASGMGRATARRLASRGIAVTLADMNGGRVRDVAKQVESTFNVRTSFFRVDVTKEQEVKDMVEHASKLTGSLDYAANCAGICETIWGEERTVSTEMFDK